MADQVAPSYEFALDEARRSFDALAGEVTIVRDRAVSVLGIGGLAASFLGGLSIRDGASLTAWTWVAAVAFAVTAALSISTLWPRRFHVSQDPASLVSWVENNHLTAEQRYRDLALWLGKKYEANRPKVDRLGAVLFCATLALLVELAALIIDLATR